MKTVLITGCSSGYGLETARHFHARGWTVIASMRHPRPDLFPISSGIRVLPLDVTDAGSIDRAVDAAGPIDVLVNNAGVGLLGAFEATPMATVREIFGTNTFGTMAMCQAVIPRFRERRAGTIVNVTSIAGSRVHPFAGAAYATSKAALASLTREMAADFGPLGVRVNAISPGEIDTSILSPGTEKIVATLPMQRLGRPDEVAKAIYFLCTEASSYVNGAELHINGGQHV